uniref:DUF202 domain-containing protein n=1 Tax=Syphacia muris TaxID=451379 RepID=A0A0N5AZ42_9BILA
MYQSTACDSLINQLININFKGNKPVTPSVVYPETVEKEKEGSAFDRFLDVRSTFDLVYRQKVVSVWGVISVTVRFLIVSLALYGSFRHRYGFYVPFMFYSIVIIIHFVMVLEAELEEKTAYANHLSEVSSKSSTEKTIENVSPITISAVTLPTSIPQPPHSSRSNAGNTRNQ